MFITFIKTTISLPTNLSQTQPPIPSYFYRTCLLFASYLCPTNH